MGNLLRNNSINNAENFIKDLDDSNYYVFFGAHSEWDNLEPIDVEDSVTVRQDTLGNILFGKKIKPENVRQVFKRVEWNPFVVYPQYDNTVDYFDNQNSFPFVITDEKKVYKCISNNLSSKSIVKPSTVSTSIFQTTDGYIWKYMFSIDVIDDVVYGSSQYIPVDFNTNVINSAQPGAIHAIEVQLPGIGYTQYNTGRLQSIIDANTIVLDITANTEIGSFANTSLYLKYGSNTLYDIVSYEASTRTAKLAKPLNIMVSLNVANASGFNIGDSVYQVNGNNTISGNIVYTDVRGVQLNVQASDKNFIPGEIVEQISPTANGIVAFSNTTTVRLVQTSGLFKTGNRLTGRISAANSLITSTVNINTITVSSDTTRFVAGGTLQKQGATVNTNVVSYSSTPDINAEYIVSPKVLIEGDGTGCQAIAIVNAAISTIQEIIVINPGQNYSQATASVLSFSVANSVIKPLLSPLKGHGADPVRETGADTIVINLPIQSNEHTRISGNKDIRTLGILKDPLFSNTSLAITPSTVRLDFTSHSGSFSAGEYVTQGNIGAIGKVTFANNTTLLINDVQGSFIANIPVYGMLTDSSATPNTFSYSNFGINDRVYQGNVSGNVLASNSTNITLANVNGPISNTVIVSSDGYTKANVVSVKTVNNVVNDFNTFEQTTRLPIHTNGFTADYNDVIIQESTNSYGTVISTSTDLLISNNVNISVGTTVSQPSTNASGTVQSSNGVYLSLINTNGTFAPNSTLVTLNGNVNVSSVFTAYYLANNSANWVSGTDALHRIVNTRTNVVGFNIYPTTIKYPELLQQTGELVYIENVSLVTKTDNTNETVKLFIKF